MSGDSTTPTVDPDDWMMKANYEFGFATLTAQLEPTPEAGHRLLTEALKEWCETCAANDPDGRHDARAWFGLAYGTALVALKAAPEEWRPAEGEFLGLGAEDKYGQQIGDIDEEMATNADRGRLAALRFYIAVANDDMPQARAIHDSLAVGPDEDGERLYAFILTLAELAGHLTLAKAVEDGTLAAEGLEKWQARRALDPPAPEAPEVFERGGLRWAKGESTPIAGNVEEYMPNGPGIYIVGIYAPGTSMTLERVGRAGHVQIRAAADGRVLCGVEHYEHIEAWQIPWDYGRTAANRAVREASRTSGRPSAIVRAWQHYGPCAESPVDPDDRTPGPDEVPLFEDPTLAAELDALHPTGESAP